MTSPYWLEILAIVSLVMAGTCAVIIVLDLLAGHKQHMWIMNLVWPITALYFGPIALWAYYKWGRSSTHHEMMKAREQGKEMPGKERPFWQSCSIATTHCGSGCVLGDIISEWVLVLYPLTLFGHEIFAAWVVDYILAFLFGIAFQYFTIKPMKQLSAGEALARALKTDALTITFWQIGMYSWMAVVTFLIFGRELEKTSPVFWFMMQIGMWFGFLTSYPTTWWLMKIGIKEKM